MILYYSIHEIYIKYIQYNPVNPARIAIKYDQIDPQLISFIARAIIVVSHSPLNDYRGKFWKRKDLGGCLRRGVSSTDRQKTKSG